VRVGTKLLIAFVGTVLLLVVLGVFGLRVLSQSNNRVERLGMLQLRAAAYRELWTEVAQLRLLLGLRAGGADVNVYVGGSSSSAPGSSLVSIDQTIASTLTQLGPATDAKHLGFVPPPSDQHVLGRIRGDAGEFSDVMTKI